MTTTTLTIDKAGRIVLPKPVRDALQISPGDSLELETSEDRAPPEERRKYGRSKAYGFFMGERRFPRQWSRTRSAESAGNVSGVFLERFGEMVL